MAKMPSNDHDRSFGAVEEKLAEAEFFLRKLRHARSLSADGRFYFSAFVSAARSVTSAIQHSLHGIEGFQQWYDTVQARLREDTLARYFLDTRNKDVHRGQNPYDQIPLSHLAESLRRQFRGERTPVLVIPDEGGALILSEATAVCAKYFTDLVTVVWECYEKFRSVVDGQWYFTKENFERNGKSLQDAVAELGLPKEWLDFAPDFDESRIWRVLRRYQSGCGVNDIFHEYLGRELLGPDEVDRPDSEA